MKRKMRGRVLRDGHAVSWLDKASVINSYIHVDSDAQAPGRRLNRRRRYHKRSAVMVGPHRSVQGCHESTGAYSRYAELPLGDSWQVGLASVAAQAPDRLGLWLRVAHGPAHMPRMDWDPA